MFGRREEILSLPAFILSRTEPVSSSTKLSDCADIIETSLQLLKRRPEKIRALHVQYPTRVSEEESRCHLQTSAYVNTFGIVKNLYRLQYLRIDVSNIQLPKGYLREFSKLRELQIMSTIPASELEGLSLEKLTLLNILPQTEEAGHAAFPVQNMHRLQHLHVIASDGFSDGPMINFNTLPALKCVALTQNGNPSLNKGFSFIGRPYLVETLSLADVALTKTFIGACQKLRHLRLTNCRFEANAFSLQIARLVTLEVIGSPAVSATLQSAVLPLLEHFLEHVDLCLIGGRQNDPLGFLRGRYCLLRTAFEVHLHTSAHRYSEKLGRKESETVVAYDLYTYKRGKRSSRTVGMLLPNDALQLQTDGCLEAVLSDKLLNFDNHGVFVQTRECCLRKSRLNGKDTGRRFIGTCLG